MKSREKHVKTDGDEGRAILDHPAFDRAGRVDACPKPGASALSCAEVTAGQVTAAIAPAARQLERHPLSEACGDMVQSTYQCLVESVAENDEMPEVVVYEGKILYPWEFYAAHQNLGKPVQLVEYQGDDPVAYIVQKHLLRPHHTDGQRAMSVVMVYDWKQRGRPKKSTPGEDLCAEHKLQKSEPELAAMAGVSVTYIQMAKAVFKHEDQIWDMVLNGDASLKPVHRRLFKRRSPCEDRAGPPTPQTVDQLRKEKKRLWDELIDVQIQYHRLSESYTEQVGARDRLIQQLEAENSALKAANSALATEVAHLNRNIISGKQLTTRRSNNKPSRVSKDQLALFSE